VPHTLHIIDDDVPSSSLMLLSAAAEARGLAVQVWPAGATDPLEVRPLPAGDLLFCPATSRRAERLAQQLFGPGVGSFYGRNGPYVEPLAADLRFARAGVPTPRSAPCVSTDRVWLRKAVGFLGGLPVVLKMGGEGGVGVMRAETWPTLFSLVDHLCQTATPTLEAWVPDAMHHRVVVVGDRAVASYLNPVLADDFRSAPSDDPADYTARVPADLAEVAVAAVRALGYDFAGVDVLAHASGRLYVIEANFPCYFPQAQEVAGIDVAGAMVDVLMRSAGAT
jgi:hypothetical protein